MASVEVVQGRSATATVIMLGRCKHLYRLRPDNAAIFTYRNAKYDHLRAVCPKCGRVTRVFNLDATTKRQLVFDYGVPRTMEKHPSKKVRRLCGG